MKRFQKRMTAILLALLMVLSIIPATVFSTAAAEETEEALFSVYLVSTANVGNVLDLTVNGNDNANYGHPYELKEDELAGSHLTFSDAISVPYTPDSTVFRVIVLENGTDKTAVLSGNYDISQMPFTMLLVPNENDFIELEDFQDGDDDVKTLFDSSNPIFYTTKPGDIPYDRAVEMWKEINNTTAKPSAQQLWTWFQQITKPAKTLKVSGSLNFGPYSGMSIAGYYYAQDVRQNSEQLTNGVNSPSNAVIGPYAHVILDNNASLNFYGSEGMAAPGVVDPSYLFTWGFISGSGTVNIHQYANVYEDFQLSDFPDLTTAKKMMDKSTGTVTGVFPTSQYYVQNIESVLNIHYGGKENIHACLALGVRAVPIEVPFVGKQKESAGDSQAMFTINSAGSYVTKEYDAAAMKTVFTVHGDTSIASLQMNLGGIADISSEDFQLPIGNIDIEVTQGSTLSIEQDLQLLPYASITVDEGATLDVQSAIYVVDAPAEDDSRTYPGVAPIALLCTSEGMVLDESAIKEIEDGNGAQLIVNGTVEIQNTNNPNKPAGIAYVGDEAISGSGTIVNNSTYEVPALNVISSTGTQATEEAEQEVVRDIEGNIIADGKSYKYSEDYDIWYVDGDPITVAFAYQVLATDDDGYLLTDENDQPYYEIIEIEGEGGEVLFGSDIEFPEAPEIEGNMAVDSYTFSKWVPADTTANKAPGKAIVNTTYIAQYDIQYNEFDVVFLDENGDELDSYTAHFGDPIVYNGPEIQLPEEGLWKGYSWDYIVEEPVMGEPIEEQGVPNEELLTYTVVGNTEISLYFEPQTFDVLWKNGNPNEEDVEGSKTEYGKKSNLRIQTVTNTFDYLDEHYSYKVKEFTYSSTDALDPSVQRTGTSTKSSSNYTVTVYGDTVCTPVYEVFDLNNNPVHFLTDYSLTLNGDIGVNIRVTCPSGYNYSDFEVVYEWGVGNSNQTVTKALEGAVTSINVAPKQMNDDIKVTLKTKDGGIVYDQKVYKVADYLNSVVDGDVTAAALNMDEGKFGALQELCKAMIFYGNRAQIQFNYNTENLLPVNPSGYTPDEDPSMISGLPSMAGYDFTSFGLKKYYGSTLQLNSKTTYALFFNVSDASAAQKVTATASYFNASDNLKELETSVYLIPDANGVQNAYLRVDLKDIPAADVSRDIRVTISDGNNSQTFDVNSGSYIKAALSQGTQRDIDTVTAFYNYNRKAIAYFTY